VCWCVRAQLRTDGWSIREAEDEPGGEGGFPDLDDGEVGSSKGLGQALLDRDHPVEYWPEFVR
jgi:hypothetical protein